MASLPYYCRPTDNVAPNATWSVTTGAADASFGVANTKDLDPENPVKSTGTSLTLRATFGSAQTIKVVQFLMHNLAGRTITITNNHASPLNTTLVPAANSLDGFCEFSWKDLRTNGSNSATQWNFAMTVASGVVWVGEITLWAEARFIPIKWEAIQGVRRKHHINRSPWGKKLMFKRLIRERTLRGTLIDNDYRDDILALEADAHGPYAGWGLIPEDTVQDSMWVQLTQDTIEAIRSAPNVSPMVIDVEETGMGMPAS